MLPLPGAENMPGAPSERPDFSHLCIAVLDEVNYRRENLSSPDYVMYITKTCPFQCCQYLHQQPIQEEEQKTTIIRKKIIRRRPALQQAQEQAPTPTANQSATEQRQRQQQQQEEEAARRQAEEQYRLEQEAQLRRQQEEELKRQQEEQERQRQLQLQREEEERQRQAQAAAAAAPAPPAAPTQKVATFTNLGTDPAMAQAELFYESTRFGPLGHGSQPISVSTYPGHRWFIVANGVYAKLFTVGDEEQQSFTI